MSLAVKEKGSVYTRYWLCSRNFNNLHKFWQSFSHNYSLSAELLLSSRSSHLEGLHLVNLLKAILLTEEREVCLNVHWNPFYSSVSLLCPQHFFLKCNKHFKCIYAIKNKWVFYSLLRDIQNSSEYIKRMKINGHFSWAYASAMTSAGLTAILNRELDIFE